MKRFLAFYGDKYYPSKGMRDFVSDHDGREDAIAALELYAVTKGDDWSIQWGQVYDTETRKEVWSK